MIDWYFFVTYIFAPLIVAVLTALVTTTIATLRRMVKARANNDLATRLILCNIIETTAKIHLQAGSISMHDRRHFAEMFEAYRSLGGNSYTTTLYDRVMKLGIKDDAGDMS